MSITYVKVTTVSPRYLEDVYARNPGMETLPYAEQLATLMADAHVWADHFTRNLRPLGVDAHEIVYNAEILQAAWAREHGTDKSGGELLIEQLKALGAEVVFLHTGFLLFEQLVPLVRERLPGLRLVHGYLGVDFEPAHARLFQNLDFVFTCEPHLRDKLAAAGVRSYHINHSFEHTLLGRLGPVDRDSGPDVIFTGSFVLSTMYHLRRMELLTALLDMGIDLTLHGVAVEVKASLPGKLRERLQPPVYGLNMIRKLAGAKIVLNNHRDTAAQPGNVRLFEATGAGACLLTDRLPGLQDIFVEDVEVAAYGSPEECAEKIRALLADPGRREAIARAGQRRTLADHRFEQRAAQLYEILKAELRGASVAQRASA